METRYSYQEAKNCLKKRDFSKARELFVKALDTSSKDYALCQLAKLDIKENDFASAREWLNCVSDEKIPLYNGTRGMLEKYEYNFEEALYYYLKCVINSTPENSSRAYFDLAGFYAQIGEYDEAKEIFTLDEFKDNYYYSFPALRNLVFMCIREGKFEEAWKYIIMFEEFINKNDKHYGNLIITLRHASGELTKMPSLDQAANADYRFLSSLFKHDPNFVINRIKIDTKRFGFSSNVYEYWLFHEGIDIEKLYEEVAARIEGINGIYDYSEVIYNLPLDRSVGTVNGEEANGLKVIALYDGKKIIAMQPVVLSSEFNREGKMEDQELARKRKGF